MRTCVLFGQSPVERARETGVPARALDRMVERVDHLARLAMIALTQTCHGR